MRRPSTWPALATAAVLAASGCSSPVAGRPVAAGSGGADRELVVSYFAELNEAGSAGPTTQRDFLRRTQHPDFANRACDLGDLTIEVEPAMSTLRVDSKWTPQGSSERPRGLVYVIGVSVSIRRDGAVLAEQIGSQRVVLLRNKAYGFTPCPTR